MDDAFFEQLGFMCGMEIHQQLDTKRKLFCRCPPIYRNDPPHYTIVRHMRPTLSEMGTYDGTALMEFKTKKNVTYQFYRDTCCSYEIDDTPPFEMDPLALEISLVIAAALNSHLVDEVHVSRKQYLDGTIPTGFQRTAIVSLTGKIPWKGDRDLLIRQISLEEDACREVSDIGHEVTFRTDRLSIPLVEVVTEPVARNPTEAREISERIGRVMRSTGLVRRGPGATRQDVNVSIKGGTRVEIKGVPFLDLIPTITAGEAIRQHNLLKIKDELAARGLDGGSMDVDGFSTMEARDVTHLLEGRQVPVMSHLWPEAIEQGSGNRVMAVLIPGFKGITAITTHHEQTFLSELSGRVRVIACLDHLPNLISSDLDPVEGMDKSVHDEIMSELGGGDDDLFIIAFGNEQDTMTAVREVYIRCREAFEGVPNETRQVISPKETSFERILPGPDRMYPDTDRPPINVDRELLERVRAQVPRPFWEEEAEMVSSGMDSSVARRMVVSPLASTYRAAVGSGARPNVAASILMEAASMARKKGMGLGNGPCPDLQRIISLVGDGTLGRSSASAILRSLLDGGSDLDSILKESASARPADETVKARALGSIADRPELAKAFREGRKDPLVGLVRKALGPGAEGRQVHDMLSALLTPL